MRDTIVLRFPPLPLPLSAMVPLVTTSRTFVRLSKSRGKLTNLGPDARCICILRRVIPRLVISDSIAERATVMSMIELTLN